MSKNNFLNLPVDLHLHTHFSDGTKSVKDYFEEADQKGYGVISITDHDCLDGIDIAMDLKNEHSTRLLNGVELTSAVNKQYVHILGYGFNLEKMRKTQICERVQSAMIRKDRNLIEFVSQTNPLVSLFDFESYQHDPHRGGWRSLWYLIDRAEVSGIDAYFKKYSAIYDWIDFPEVPTPEEIILTIEHCNGISVLAHPATTKIFQLEKLLEYALSIGIKGIECYHPMMTSEESLRCIHFCQKNALYITGGSDDHGNFSRTRKFGSPKIMGSDLVLKSTSMSILDLV